jgi:hypothetical protein
MRRLPLVLIAIASACTSAPAPAAPSADVSASPIVTDSPEPSPSSPATPTEPAAEPAWTELATTGPAPREDHTWTLGAGGVAYLFGGRDGATVFDDLWSYELATDTWTPLGARGPAARFGHNAAWADGIGLVVFAGQAGAAFFNDLWAYDPAADGWRQLPAGGAVPVPRYGSCAAIGPDGDLWISHGFTSDGTRFADTRAYDFATGAWTDVTPAGDLPVARCLHACWWTDAGDFTLYAGQTTGVTALGDWWTREPAAGWARTDGALPPERNLPAAARWGEATIAFGGQAVDGAFLADVWRLDDAGGATAIPVEGGPAGRAGAELVADSARERLVLFGGRDASASFGDTWELNLPSPG